MKLKSFCRKTFTNKTRHFGPGTITVYSDIITRGLDGRGDLGSVYVGKGGRGGDIYQVCISVVMCMCALSFFILFMGG